MAAFVALGAAALSGCTHAAEGAVDSRINAALPHYLGPADHYETHIDAASTGALMRGRARSVQVTGVNVHLRPDLVIDEMTVTAQAVEVDPHHGTLESIGSASFTGTISSDNLSHYVDHQKFGIPDLHVKLANDRIEVKAKPKAEKILPIPVTARGTLSPTPEGDHINFLPDRGSVTILPVPGPVLDYLSLRFNPVIDLTGLPVPITVTSATIVGDRLTITGTVDTAAILKAAH